MQRLKKIIKETILSMKYKVKYLYLKNSNIKGYEKVIKKDYKKNTSEDLNLKKPVKYTEKMQYSKLYLNTPLKTKLTDKYLVREWVSNKIGQDYLIPLLGVWDEFDEINLNNLPEKFVLKMNHASGWNVIVKEKSEHDFNTTKKKFDKWTKLNYAFYGDIQLHYEGIEPKIVAEEYIKDINGQLNDYKFLCFNGKVYYCWLDFGRYETHYRNVYDLNWNLQEWNQNKYKNFPEEVSMPPNFKKMIEIAQILCQGFSHVRVDLYNVDGQIFFGEMTFTSGGGYSLMTPDKYNTMLGDLWDINVEESAY